MMTTSRFSKKANYQRVLIFIAALWCIPTALALTDYNPALTQQGTIYVGLITLLCMIWRPFYTLLGLPFFALLSPAGGLIEFYGMKAALTDWIMPIILFRALFLLRLSRIRLSADHNNASYYLTPLAALFILSFLIGVLLGHIISGAALYYLVCYVVIFIFFQKTAYTEIEWQAIIWAWTVASVLGGFILINSFFLGKHLINFSTDSEMEIDRQSLEYLFRASYYYAGFHFVAGILAVGLSLRLALIRDSLLMKSLLIFFLVTLIFSLLFMVAKTALISAALAVAFVYATSTGHLRRLNLISILAIVTFSLSAIIIFVRIQSAISESNELLISSVASSGSLIERIVIWSNALKEFLNFPLAVLIGLGPNVLENGSIIIADPFKQGSLVGGAVGAVDSTWLTYLLEFGIVGVLLIISLIAKAINICSRFSRQMRKGIIVNTSFLTVFGSLFFIIFSFISQSVGYAKVSWLPFQLILIAFAYFPLLRRR